MSPTTRVAGAAESDPARRLVKLGWGENAAMLIQVCAVLAMFDIGRTSPWVNPQLTRTDAYFFGVGAVLFLSMIVLWRFQGRSQVVREHLHLPVSKWRRLTVARAELDVLRRAGGPRLVAIHLAGHVFVWALTVAALLIITSRR